MDHRLPATRACAAAIFQDLLHDTPNLRPSALVVDLWPSHSDVFALKGQTAAYLGRVTAGDGAARFAPAGGDA